MLIINPGTHADNTATEANAIKIADGIVAALTSEATPVTYERQPEHDRDGWFDFLFRSGSHSVPVSIPGDDPATVEEGMPFKSRRLYVDGSSWLYGFAIGFIASGVGLE